MNGKSLSVDAFLSEDSDSIETFDSSGSLNAEVLEKICSLRLVRFVQICDTNISTAVLRKIASALPWSELRGLTLRNCQLGPRGAKTLAEFLPKCAHSHNFVHLDVSANDMQHFGLQALGQVFPTTLETLNLASNKMGFDGMWKASQNLSSLTHLRSIDLSNNNIADDGCMELAKHVSQLNFLMEILLGKNDIGDTGFASLAEKLQNHPKLERLHLPHNRVSDASIQKLGPMPALRDLVLHHNQIQDAGCTFLAEALLAPGNEESSDEENYSESDDEEKTPGSTLELQRLDLSHNQIGDEGAGSFVEHLDDIPTLVELKLDGNNVSEARTRILDMLLKHRTVTSSGGNTLVSPVRGQSGTAGGTPGTLSKAGNQVNLNNLPTVLLEEELPVLEQDILAEDGMSVNTDAVDEGRDILAALSLDHEELSELPMEYIGHLTGGFKKFIGYGAFGRMYRGNDDGQENLRGFTFLARRLILSTAGPLESIRAKVLDELATLRHENCAPVLAFAKKASIYVFLYENNDTLSLRDCLASEGGRQELPWANRLAVMTGVASALDFLHCGEGHSSMFHGDIRPDNILISADRMTARLVDVGLSRLLATDRARFASSDVVFGSRGYRCPRYERGSCSYDTASDMFSYGIVLAEVVTGTLQRSGSKSMAHDVYYDVILPRRPLETDPLAGKVTKLIMEGVGKVVVSCLNSNVTQRPSANTVARILHQ